MGQTATEPADRLLDGDPVSVINPEACGNFVLVCEHASNSVPSVLSGQLAADDVLQSHAGWDPGALEVAERLSSRLQAPLVSATVSRLVYDLNRPPTSPDAMRETSELHAVPGNAALTSVEREARVAEIYVPFHAALSQTLRTQQRRTSDLSLVTIHTFAPTYFGVSRSTEVGVLHDEDSRLAVAVLAAAAAHDNWMFARNDPYGPEDGVTHTLRKHALPAGIPNVMIEVRNDLVETSEQQDVVAELLAAIIVEAVERLGAQKDPDRGGALAC